MKKIVFIIAALSISCSGVVKDKGTVVVNTAIDCAKADIGQTIPEIGLTILTVATQILMAGEGNYIEKLDELGAKYGNDAEACAVKAVNTVLATADGAGHAMSPAVARSTALIVSKGWKFKVEK